MLFEVPGYHLIEKLSENAAFKVYRGQRSQNKEAVLLKVLNHAYPSPKYLAPLWQEFEILRRLDFPGVEKAYAIENHQHWWMIVLEDFGGRPLDELGIAGCMEPEEFLNLALQLAGIVEEIHARQVIHKNISPSNVLFNLSTCQARLMNFGNASLVSKEEAPVQSPYKLAELLDYISPEMTGRMNRSVDYRTDYYSLGATLYELLTGTPPFLGETPFELVHAHLAILPDPPASRIEPWSASPTAFQILSAILLKLLAKNPEDRYQTPAALRADLRQCLSALQEPSRNGSETLTFVPGQVDRPVDLNIPQMVVGRERETEALLQAFLRTIGGPGELVLVRGEAGVGKTTLVNQLVRPVTERAGLFLHAKFDRVRQKEVYRALTEVLEEFCRLVLSEPAPSFNDWRERVQAGVAPHGQLLTDLCPQLEMVIGPQPPVEPVDEALARPRLHQVVIRFLQAICRPEVPVVIFLDDLQWINPDSLLLWQRILSTPSIQNLLVVGAYRDTEADRVAPIHRLVDGVRWDQRQVRELKLRNLEWPMIHRLVAASLASDPAEISELTTLVYLKTEGNPYFSNEFIKSLYKDQLLAFNLVEQKWRWDTNKIETYGVASNVADLFVHEIAKLDEDTQKVLQYAACTGRRFHAATLLAILGQDKASSLANSLWQAMMEGLIRPLDENYRFLASENMDGFSAESDELLPTLVDLLEEEILFEFQHERVQQAAISMLDERQLRNISLQIGWLLLEKAERTSQETLQGSLLAIVDHLNTGSPLIEDPVEAIKAAQLNLMASNQARAIAAFEAASSYLSAGMQLLPVDSWQDHYTLTLELFTAGAEVALLNGDLARSEALALSAESNARTLLEKARVIKIRMDIYLIQTKLDQVIELGISAIKMLGFDLEVREPPAFIGEQAMQLPDMTEPRALAVSRLVEPLFSAAFARNDTRFVQLTLFFIDLFSRFGNPPGASYVYLVYALILLSQFEQVEQVCKMGRMALELAEKGGPSKTLYAVRFVYYAFFHHWLEPAREGLSLLHENIQPAVESGNLRFSINSQDLEAQNSLFVGLMLEQVWSKQAEALRQLELLKQVGYTQRLRIWAQVVLKLMGESHHPQEITGDLFDDEEEQKLKEAGQNQNYMFNMYVAQSFLSLLFREPQRAVETSASADAIRLSARTQLIYANHLFIYSLALLSAELDAGDLAARLEKVEENLRLMRLWAGLVPENFLHQLELVEAEQARCLGREGEATESYERAIQDAQENGYIHESALAAELAAEFYLAREDYSAAKDHLFTAYYSYLAWGAKAKVEDLVKRYPEWLLPGRDDEKRANFHPAAKDLSIDEIASSIDLNTILKASLELTQETSLEELLRKLMSILIENAGAQNGSLILLRDDRWFLEVQGSTDPRQDFILLSIPLEAQATQMGGPKVPVSIIHYVINSQVNLLLKDASASHQFSQDPYIQSQRPKSILCAPLLNQGVLYGVVYLENNLAAGAFTSDRLEIVQLISGQAAVSIEKARLYENLEALVEERTRELTDTNTKLKKVIDERIRADEALRLSEERYRTVFENTGTAMAIVDEEGYILLTNDEFMRLTGYSRDELGNHFNSLDLAAPADVDKIRQLRQTRLADPSQVPHSYEFKLVDRSGSEKVVLNTATFLPGSKSNIISLIDISQRKSAEEALRYNEALLRKVLEILPVGVWIMDKTPKIISGNPEGQRIWSGAKYVEIQGFGEYKAWRVGTGERVRVEEWAGELAITKGQTTLNEELEIEAFDGTHRIILNSAMPLAIEGDGLVGAIVVNQDITERKRDEEELQKAHDQLSTLLHISQSIVSTLDLDRLLNLIIEQLEEVMPYEAAAILILEQNMLGFRIIRGPSIFHGLLKYQIPVRELTIIEPYIKGKEAFYLPDLQADEDLLFRIQDTIKIPFAQFAFLRSWLGLPLIARDDLVGLLVLAHSQPDYYPLQSRVLSQAYANQVAIAIQNAQLYKRAQDIAAMEERTRLARELHDSVTQVLFSANLLAEVLPKIWRRDPEQGLQRLDKLQRLTRGALAEMRTMLVELRPSAVTNTPLSNLLAQLTEAVTSRSGLPFQLFIEQIPPLPEDVQMNFYRIAQEALNNVVKHAQAKHVIVSLSATPLAADANSLAGREVKLVIEDDGVGYVSGNEQSSHLGIGIMRERAASIQASLSLESQPGYGTQVTLIWSSETGSTK